MYAKYNMNIWFMEIARFYRAFIQAMRHFKQIIMIPIVVIIKSAINIMEYPHIKRQVAPGIYEEIPNREIEFPQII